jgi:hypothetical protein
MAVYHLAQFSAFDFHLPMVLHTANTLLVFHLSSDLFPNFSRLRDAAPAAAGIFAVHSIHSRPLPG